MPFTSDSSWFIVLLLLLGYELYESNRKLGKIHETLLKILERK